MEHMLRQHILGIAAGYEDLNDHATAEASQKMAASVESLALAIRDNTAEMRSRFPLSSPGVKPDPVRSSLER